MRTSQAPELIGMMGSFIDTIIVCTMTGLAIIVTGVWTDAERGDGTVNVIEC